MNKKLVVSGAAIIAVAATLFGLLGAQPPTTDCRTNCGPFGSGQLYLTSLLPLTIGTLGAWLLGVGIRRK